MSSILISGSAGFIGSHIVDKLIELGHDVVGIDNLSSGYLKNINNKCAFVNRDVRNDLSDLFRMYRFDYVFHLAAQINLRHSIKNPKNDADTNIIGTLNVIENCCQYGVKRFIFSSTGGAIYSPEAPLPWTEDTSAVPASPYGLAKLTCERYLKIAKNLHGLNYTALRYANVYGPRQNSSYSGIVSIVTKRALRNDGIVINGTGLQTRDFVQIKDVVAANVLAMEANLNGIFNVSSNEQVSVNEIKDKVLAITGSTSVVQYVDAVPGEIRHTRLSSEKLMSHGWKNSVSFDDGLKDTIEWMNSDI